MRAVFWIIALCAQVYDWWTRKRAKKPRAAINLPHPWPEHSVIRTTKIDVEGDIPSGTEGTIVSIYDNPDAPYVVEFNHDGTMHIKEVAKANMELVWVPTQSNATNTWN